MTPAPATTLSILPVKSVVKLISPNVKLIDTRHRNLYDLEHIHTAIPPPSNLSNLSGHTVIVYDAGATDLSQHFTHAVTLINQILHECPVSTSIFLAQGGFAAIKAHSPHIVACTNAYRLRKRAPRWAKSVLDALIAEAQPPAPVLPWLFVGAERHATNLDWLNTHNVTHVITVREQPIPPNPGITYLHISARDSEQQSLLNHFPTCIKFLQSVKATHATCLVHCTAGASRSVAVVAAYLIANGLSPTQAVQKIKSARRAADPNSAFLKQLDKWDTLVSRGFNTNLIVNQQVQEDDDDDDDDDDEDSLDGDNIVKEIDNQLDQMHLLVRHSLSSVHLPSDIPVSPVTPSHINRLPVGDNELNSYQPSSPLALSSPVFSLDHHLEMS